MNKRGWFIPVLIIAINALAIIARWSFLPEIIPAHFDLDGHADGSIPRYILLLYPLISTVISLAAYRLTSKFDYLKKKLQTGFIILSTGFCLILLSSTAVSLTSGQMPFFMLAEPVILLIAIIAFAICLIRARRAK